MVTRDYAGFSAAAQLGRLQGAIPMTAPASLEISVGSVGLCGQAAGVSDKQLIAANALGQVSEKYPSYSGGTSMATISSVPPSISLRV